MSYAIGGVLAAWSLPALFAGAGALLTAAGVLAAASRTTRAIARSIE